MDAAIDPDAAASSTVKPERTWKYMFSFLHWIDSIIKGNQNPTMYWVEIWNKDG